MRHGAPVAKAKSEYQYHIRHNLSSGRIDKSRRVALFVPAYLVRSRRVRYSGVCQEQLKQGACGLVPGFGAGKFAPRYNNFPGAIAHHPFPAAPACAAIDSRPASRPLGGPVSALINRTWAGAGPATLGETAAARKHYKSSVNSSTTASADKKSSSRKYSLRMISTGTPAEAAAFRPLAESSIARQWFAGRPSLASTSR